MDMTLEDKCLLMAENRQIFAKAFPLELSEIHPLCALIYTYADKKADVVQLKESRTILRENAGLFSGFRNETNLITITKMSLAMDPTTYIRNSMMVYDMLMEGKICASDYRAMAAMMIVDHARPDDYDRMAKQTRYVLQKMKENHFFITGEEDVCYAAAIALTEKDPDILLMDAEQCYTVMRSKFGLHPMSIQALSHLLCLEEASPEFKCRKVGEIFDCLKEDGLRFSKGKTLATMGGLAGLDMSPENIARKIEEAEVLLKKQKGFHGIFGTGADLRKMYAALMVIGTYSAQGNAGAVDTTMSVIMQIVIETILCIIVVTQTAIHSSSSRSN